MSTILSWFGSYLIPNVFQFYLSLDIGFGVGSFAVINLFVFITFLVIKFVRGLI